MERRLQTQKCTGGTPAGESWCPYCYENRRGRSSHKGHGYRQSPVTRIATYQEYQMKRPSQATRPKKGEFTCPDAAFLLNYPELAKGLCDPFWDDGKSRKCWTLKISMNDETVLLVLNDPDSKLVAFTTASGLDEGLLAIEQALAGEGVSWRKSKF